METLETLARHAGPRGEVVLRHRHRAGAVVEELIVNGAFAMDSADTFTERRLAAIALAGRPDLHPGVGAGASGRGDRPAASVRCRVLVGGLGLGYTAAELLAAGVDRVDVVEIEECLVEWAYAGLTPTLAAVARDPRVALHTADVTDALGGAEPGLAGPWDAIVLDVDNGPDFLIHASNDRLYRGPLLAAAYARLSEHGVLAIWCQGPSPDLLAALEQISDTARTHLFSRVRDGRTLDYAIYTVTRGRAGRVPADQDRMPAEQECGP